MAIVVVVHVVVLVDALAVVHDEVLVLVHVLVNVVLHVVVHVVVNAACLLVGVVVGRFAVGYFD